MEDLEGLHEWLIEVDQQTSSAEPPTIGENLLDQKPREKIPLLCS
jgi:hypothetical protein